jgi:hypothetical protein
MVPTFSSYRRRLTPLYCVFTMCSPPRTPILALALCWWHSAWWTVCAWRYGDVGISAACDWAARDAAALRSLVIALLWYPATHPRAGSCAHCGPLYYCVMHVFVLVAIRSRGGRAHCIYCRSFCVVAGGRYAAGGVAGMLRRSGSARRCGCAFGDYIVLWCHSPLRWDAARLSALTPVGAFLGLFIYDGMAIVLWRHGSRARGVWLSAYSSPNVDGQDGRFPSNSPHILSPQRDLDGEEGEKPSC